MPFVWVIRTWCSLDTFWEAIRSSKEYDRAFSNPEIVLDEIKKIIVQEESEWKEICQGSTDFNAGDKEFLVELPTVDQIKNRPFVKFFSVTSSQTAKEQFVQNWYVERLRKLD